MGSNQERLARPSDREVAIAAVDEVDPKDVARVSRPNRQKIETRSVAIESLLPEHHRARTVWRYVEQQNLAKLYACIKAIKGGSGRPAIAPEILLALWLFAVIEGVGSARQVAKLAVAHDAYRWICGGVSVNYHTLADFRSMEGDTLDEILSDNLACLVAVGLVKLKAVAHDGMRVRASAGAASFRREEKLRVLKEDAHERVVALKREVAVNPGAQTKRKEAAQTRAALSRETRINEALDRMKELADIKKRQGKKAEEARASTTDAEATVMKMGDGGFRPAYNVELATDTETLIIVGVDVVTTGSDMGQMAPMVKQVIKRCSKNPENWLVDGGFPAHDQIDAVAELTRVIAPVPKPKAKAKVKDDVAKVPEQSDVREAPVQGDVATVSTQGETQKTTEPVINQYQRKPTDSQAVGDWRERMATDEAKELYKKRAATAECINAQARNRNLVLLPVRGQKKVKGVVLLFVLAHNLMRMVSLAPEWVGIGTGTSGIPGMVV